MCACVYKLTFPNGKSYVGIAKNFDKRWRVHKHRALVGNSNLAVHRAIRKYGIESVDKKLILIGDYEYVKMMEVAIIAALGTQAPNGYNITPGGEGVVHTEEMRHQASVRERARITPEYREFRRAQAIGRKMTPEQNAKNSAAKRLHWQDPDYRAKLLAFHNSKTMSDETKAKMGESQAKAWTDPKRREAGSLAMIGRKAINNGVDSRYLKPGETLPDGWAYGLINRTFVGRIWITDGVQSRRVPPDYPMPDGWRLGNASKGKPKPRKMKSGAISA